MALRTANPGVAVKSRRLTDDERADLLLEYYKLREGGHTALDASRMVNTSYLTLSRWESNFDCCLRFLSGEAWICDKSTRAVRDRLSEAA